MRIVPGVSKVFKSPQWIGSIFLTLLALSVFLFSVTASFAYSANAQGHFTDRGHDFGLHGGFHKPSRSFNGLPAGVSPNTSFRGSYNWAGFFVGTGSGNGFKEVTGNWNTPCTAAPINSNHIAAEWVGLGGYYGTGNLLQTGTVLLADGRFHIFYELFPNTPVVTNQTFNCGNSFTAEVDYNFVSTGNNKNHIFIKNITTGFTLDTTLGGFQPDLESAEWIDERPSCGGNNFTDLANFHYVNWSSTLARPNFSGAGYNGIGNFVNTNLTMEDHNTTTLAHPDGLNANNTFVDRWYNAGSDGHC